MRVEPVNRGDLAVSVREPEPEFGIPWDGVWVDGDRSYDTYVIIDGVVRYHAPIRSPAVERCFELHEQRGGGHTVL